jgi:hypothetical protein
LEFRISLLPHDGNTDWIKATVLEARRVLDQERAPERDPECPYCSFMVRGAEAE